MKYAFIPALLLGLALLGHWIFTPSQKENVIGGLSSEENLIRLNNSDIAKFEIALTKAEPGELAIHLDTRGKIAIHPDCLAHIIPNVSGIALEAYVNIGDNVAYNELLAVLASREMADAKANYLAALEKEKLALAQYQREETLFRKNVTAEQDFLNAKAAYENAKIEQNLARQKLRAFGVEEAEIIALENDPEPKLREYAIRSPLKGTVLKRHITNGEFIESSREIYQIADLSRVWVEMDIYPQDLNKVKAGLPVQISLPSAGLEGEGHLIYISPLIQENTIAAKAVAEVDNSQEIWRPGQYVKVHIAMDQIPVALQVPITAIQEINGEKVVFAKTADGFEKRVVELGRTDKTRVEILKGLNAGEEIAAANTFLLKAELGKSSVEDDD